MGLDEASSWCHCASLPQQVKSYTAEKEKRECRTLKFKCQTNDQGKDEEKLVTKSFTRCDHLIRYNRECCKSL